MLASEKGRMLAERMPRERVLTESDGPFAQLNGKALLPWQTEDAFEALSRIWSVSTAEVERSINRNLKALLAKHLAATEMP
jgi:TatD DNase family protein